MYKIPHKQAPLKEDKPVRLSYIKWHEYQEYVYCLGICQVCEESTELDAPHHTKQGLGVKDDRSIICICIDCHREIHTLGFSKLKKTRSELEEIGETNWLIFQEQELL